ncbi:MAG TPA: hypothetical protein VI603_11855 [Saprospiraceae bacterium]|nr:hypothetical protein [Saprospiraceae bacterium]
METKERKTSSAMSEHMSKYPESGMTQKAYCEAHGISPATFGYWLKKHRANKNEGERSFVRMNPKNTESADVEIHYTNGTVVRFQGLVDTKYIKELIR